MKKYLCMIIICLLTTGCTVEYNLNIDEQKITENFTIQIKDLANLDTECYKQLTSSKNDVYFQEKEHYLMNYKEYDNVLISNFKYTHDLEKYNKATLLDLCYPNRSIETTEEEIKISTKGSLSCAFTEFGEDITNAKINITTDLKVLENNADEINGNTYTWNIDEENYTNKPINITMQKKLGIKSVVKNLEGNSASQDLFIIYGGLALLLGLIILLVTIKLKNNNKI